MKYLTLLAILLVAAFFRLYSLSSVPPSPSLDEVSIGYNAYSILLTGKDEYGSSLPLLLRAYDDFRPALYMYLTVPFVWLLGLTALAVRLPSVLLSILTVYITYMIGRIVGKKYLSFDRLGDIAAALLAISPWHIYLSRLGHEVNVGLVLVVCGIYFLLCASISDHKASWGWAAVMFGLSLHGYQSEKIVSPLLALFFGILFWKNVWKARIHVIVAIVVGLVIAVPAIVATLSPSGLIRFRGTSAFEPNAPKMVYVSTFFNNYMSHFSPGWLFRGSDREAHKTPGMGLLYVWEAPLLLLGLWALVKTKKLRQFGFLLFAWIAVSPVPAAITTQAPHAMRAFTIIPALQLLEALGLWFFVRKLTKRQIRVTTFVLGMVIASGISLFWRGYFVRFPREQSDSFQYAMRPAMEYARSYEGAYTRIEVSNQDALYQSYMFFLFYSTFDPRTYISLGGTKSGGYQEAHSIGKYAFGILPQDTRLFTRYTLYMYDAKNVPSGLRVLETFHNRDNTPAIVAAAL